MDSQYTLEIYATENGNEPFNDWLNALKNLDTQALIFQRLQRIRLGNFGDCKPISDGVWEFRIHSTAGYRIYYSCTGKRTVLLLCAGDKGGQKKDIKQAIKYLEDYKRRTNEK